MHASLDKTLQRNPDDPKVEWISTARSFYIGFPLNSVNCSLKTKSLRSLPTVKLTIILQLLSKQEPEEHECLKQRAEGQGQLLRFQMYSTPSLPDCSQCARTKSTAVCARLLIQWQFILCPVSSSHCCFRPEGITLFPEPCLRPNSPRILG